MQDYDTPLQQMKSISYNIKRIADALEAMESQRDIKTRGLPATMSESYQYNPGTTKNQTDDKSVALRSFLANLK